MQYEIVVRYPVYHKPHAFAWKPQRNTYSLARAREIADTYIRINNVCMVLPAGSYERMMK